MGSDVSGRHYLPVDSDVILGLQPRDKAAIKGFNAKRIFSRRINMKIECGSLRTERVLFLTTNRAAVTSRANQKLRE